ncbi:MAG TPA: twin-arginine translocation signal domain-containing protein, partial [Candidatus Binatia bacterium]|nr:twin-arginine translocation signal domain-containing protein [Candidatus Binatia bacterium]
MDKKTRRNSFHRDPTIENLEPEIQNRDGWSRREFLSAAALAGTGALLGLTSDALAAEPPLETTKLKLDYRPSICVAPQYVAEEFLRAEGFTDVQYIKMSRPKDI